jgi:hypothetical protein
MENHTVFVIGAGASAPYDYPLGVGLVNQITGRTGQPETREFFEKAGFTVDHLRDFSSALARSGRRSVDAFLEHRTEFLEIGRVAIARVLIEHENTDLPFTDRERGWLFYLFEK